MNFLTAKEISKSSLTGFALQKISFTLGQFQKLCIVGETGSGKSTLLKIIGGLLQPDSGKVFFQDKPVLDPNEQLIPGHRGIAYLSQHFELRNNYFVHEVLEYATKIPSAEADKVFAVCQVNHLLKRKTDQVSGGERQRIALARLLVGSPKLLLLDEPFSNLDIAHKKIIKQVIKDIGDELKITCILVSHDPVDILSWADEIFILKDGKIIQSGKSKEIYFNPTNEYAAGLFGAYNLINDNSDAIRNSWSLVNEERFIVIRPENILITEKKTNTIKAIISKITFCGNYTSIEAKTDEQHLLLHTQKNSLKVGDEVFLMLG